MQSFNNWFFNQFVPQQAEDEEKIEEPKPEKKTRRRKQKYIHRKNRAQARSKARR